MDRIGVNGMNEENKINKMYELGKKYRTDKVSPHNYHEIFPFYIEKFYDKSGGIMEIGMQKGPSLKMWLELFPRMHIYGLDIEPRQTTGERHTIIENPMSI